MPDYTKAKIYQIISPNHPVPYIGSTTQTPVSYTHLTLPTKA